MNDGENELTLINRLKKCFYILVGLTLAIWPYGFNLPYTNLRIYRLGMILVLIMGGYLIVREKRWTQLIDRMLIPFALFVILNVISFLILSHDHSLSFHPNVFKVAGSFLVFLVIYLLIIDMPSYDQIINTIIYISIPLIFVLILLHMFYFKSPYLTQFFTLEGGIVGHGNKNRLGWFMVIIFPLIYAKFTHRKSIINTVSFVVISMAIIYTLSRMALIMWLISMIAYTFVIKDKSRYLKQLAAIFIIITISCIIFGVGPKKFLDYRYKSQTHTGGVPVNLSWFNLNSSRGVYIGKAWKGFVKHPVFGNGLASFGRDNPDRCASKDQQHCSEKDIGYILRIPLTHNDYMQILYELGLIGAILFAWMVLTSLNCLLKVRNHMPVEYRWIAEGITVSFLLLMFSLLFINAYGTLWFWVVIASGLIFKTIQVSAGRKDRFSLAHSGRT